MNCSYYRAKIDKQYHLFVVGTFKYYDHVCFDRTFDAQEGILEFYVPVDQENYFLTITQRMQERGFVDQMEKLPNRLDS